MEFKKIFKMSDEEYDLLQYLYRRALPAISLCFGTIGTALHYEPTALILTIWGAIYLMIGQILGMASDNYKIENEE